MRLTKKQLCSILLDSYNTFIEDNSYIKQRMDGILSEKIRVNLSPVAVVALTGSAAVNGTAPGAV